MKQKRHESNEFYRLVVDKLGYETVRLEQQFITGKTVSAATVRRYYNGYGEYQAIPRPGFEAALALAARKLISSTNVKATHKPYTY